MSLVFEREGFLEEGLDFLDLVYHLDCEGLDLLKELVVDLLQLLIFEFEFGYDLFEFAFTMKECFHLIIKISIMFF